MSRNKNKLKQAIAAKARQINSRTSFFLILVMIATNFIAYFTWQQDLHAQKEQHKPKINRKEIKVKLTQQKFQSTEQELEKVRLLIKKALAKKQQTKLLLEQAKQTILKARELTEQALQKSQKARYSRKTFVKKVQAEKMKTFHEIGFSYKSLGLKGIKLNRQKAIYYLKKSSKVLQQYKKENLKEWSDIQHHLADIYRKRPKHKLKNLSLAVKYYKLALSAYMNQNRPSLQAKSHLNLALTHNELAERSQPKTLQEKQHYQQALRSYEKALSYYTFKRNSSLWRLVYINVQRSAYQLAKNPKASKQRTFLLNKSLHYSLSLSRYWKTQNNRRKLFQSLNNAIFIAGTDLKNAELAFKLLQKQAQAFPKNEGSQVNLIEGTLHLGRRQKTLLLAKKYLKQGKEPCLRIIAAHISWLTYSLEEGKQASQAKQSCQVLLQLYNKNSCKNYGWNFEATRTFIQQQKSSQVQTLERSLSLFKGQFSCKRYRSQAALCQIQLPANAPCSSLSKPLRSQPAPQIPR